MNDDAIGDGSMEKAAGAIEKPALLELHVSVIFA